jgi:hypothetical protein
MVQMSMALFLAPVTRAVLINFYKLHGITAAMQILILMGMVSTRGNHHYLRKMIFLER